MEILLESNQVVEKKKKKNNSMIVNPSNFQTIGIDNRSSKYNPQLLNTGIKNTKSQDSGKILGIEISSQIIHCI